MREVVELFQALADETRLRLVKLLGVAENGVCVCELVDALRLPQYQVSRHLAVLKAKGLVEDRQDGTWVYYRRREDLSPLAAAVIAAIHKIKDKISEEDRRRLELRLALRDGGRCVIGYDPAKPYREIIPRRAVLTKKEEVD